MIQIVITSFNEPKSTTRAINAFLSQDTKEEFKIIVVDPFPETENILKKEINDKKVSFFLDPGEGKSYALNLLLQEIYSKNKNDIIVFTDGDVYVSENVLSEICKAFKNSEVGCVTGKPVPIESRKEKYGYWAHFVFEGIHRARKKYHEKKQFFECSGYLFAIRNGVVMNFPMDASEDAIIPYLFWKKGYKTHYAEKAEVYVKNPSTWNDWLLQKIRNIKGHENLNKIFPEMPRTKSFFNEIRYGWHFFFIYPKNPKELFWTLQIYLARLYLYYKAFSEIKNKKSYSDGWLETDIKSTRTLD